MNFIKKTFGKSSSKSDCCGVQIIEVKSEESCCGTESAPEVNNCCGSEGAEKESCCG